MARILIIDDSRVQRAMLRLVCEDGGHQVEDVEDGQSGATAAAAGTFDLILLDFHLPDMSACDVLGRFQEAGVAGVVLVLTADTPGEEHQACLGMGAQQVVEKPDNPADLLALLDEALGA